MTRPDRKTPRLRFGRTSVAGAGYFVTLCTQDRAPVLSSAREGGRIRNIYQALHESGDIVLWGATIMPDHVHLLFNLGLRLKVGQVMGKLKTLARDRGLAPWHWEQDGFEHQVRKSESFEDYGFYIFMNPYRAGLSPLTEQWPWWVCPQPSRFRFLDSLQPGGAIPAEWLNLSDQVATGLVTGE